MEPYIKPPIGIEPKSIWKTERMLALLKAIERYLDSNLAVPQEWIKEFIEIGKELKVFEE